MITATHLGLLCGMLCLATSGSARLPSSASAIKADYAVNVDPSTSSIAVEMRLRDMPAQFSLAMSTHPEYDDQYWRYLEDLRVESTRGPATVTRADSAVWRINAPAGDVIVRYRVHFPASPPRQQPTWKAHLTPTGGLIGGPHSFLYVVGAEHAPAHVALTLPNGWKVATGLDTAEDRFTYTAPSAEALIDSPILVGLFRDWRFTIDGVPHDIAYLGAAGGATFDTTLFVANVERIARATARMFGSMPYRRYQFLFEDGASGGLEHLNSVSIGTQSTALARDPNAYLAQLAHEYFHTWNEVHIRPAAWIGLRHITPAATGELWFSEGVTLYYADLLLRRAGLHTSDSTRVAHLERTIGVYAANPSHAMVSPEATSRAFNLQAATGDFIPSMYTQGELLGAVLDVMIRDGSAGRRSLDDVLRALSARFSPARGFVGEDVERAVSDACSCDAHSFFDTYVRAAGALDVNRWLAVIGLRSVVAWTPALAADGSPAPDLRVSAYRLPGETGPRLQIWFPTTVWGRAGLHTGDRLVSWNGAPVSDVPQFRAGLDRLRIGDTVRVGVARDSGVLEKTIILVGYDRPTARIEERPDATDAQRRLRSQWLNGR